MENNTWIKLYRKLLQSPIFDNEKALKIWIWCLLKATHTERNQLVGRQNVILQKGQFIFGRKKASEELKMTENMVYRYMKLLEELSMLNIKSNNKFSIVSIEKWENYQINKDKITSNSTTNRQQIDTNKNVNNIYLYLLNKYTRENRKDFNNYIKTVLRMKQDEKWEELNWEEQQKLISEI